MLDTNPEIEQKMYEMFRQKSPIARAKIGSSMHKTSKHLVTRAILEHNPGISKANLRKELFLKFYGNDFSPYERDKILQYLEANTL